MCMNDLSMHLRGWMRIRFADKSNSEKLWSQGVSRPHNGSQQVECRLRTGGRRRGRIRGRPTIMVKGAPHTHLSAQGGATTQLFCVYPKLGFLTIPSQGPPPNPRGTCLNHPSPQIPDYNKIHCYIQSSQNVPPSAPRPRYHSYVVFYVIHSLKEHWKHMCLKEELNFDREHMKLISKVHKFFRVIFNLYFPIKPVLSPETLCTGSRVFFLLA